MQVAEDATLQLLLVRIYKFCEKEKKLKYKKANGLLFTFGWNHYGQLGHGAPCFGGEDLQLVPKIVEGLKSHFVVQVACGEQHTIALVRS